MTAIRHPTSYSLHVMPWPGNRWMVYSIAHDQFCYVWWSWSYATETAAQSFVAAFQRKRPATIERFESLARKHGGLNSLEISFPQHYPSPNYAAQFPLS